MTIIVLYISYTADNYIFFIIKLVKQVLQVLVRPPAGCQCSTNGCQPSSSLIKWEV